MVTQFGDLGEVFFWPNSTSPQRLETVACSIGGSDEIHGGDGPVDYLIGGSYNDTIYGDGGVDVVFGDHAVIDLSETMPFKLQYAKTIEHACKGGDDTMFLGSGDDLAFGGALNDTIAGNAGQDIIFGDFGFYNSSLAYPQYYSFIESSAFTGDDVIDGGPGDDIIFGQEGDDVIEGGEGSDDISGGHNVLYGMDGSDTLSGGDGDDVIIGDNGEILRQIVDVGSSFPFDNMITWKTFPFPFPEVIRDIQRYDDVDLVFGDDTLAGGAANDILHGQRGDDSLSGGPGEDELYGELGDDILEGGSGNDILLGDIGYIIRRYDASGEGDPLLTSGGVWSKDIILEEQGFIRSSHLISTKLDVATLKADQILSTSMLIAASGFNSDGTKAEDGTGAWITELLLYDLQPSNNDVLRGGNGDDILIGQRGDDTLVGDGGNDLIIGDSGSNVIPFNMDTPNTYEMYRALPSADTPGYVIPEYGALFTIDYSLFPDQYRFSDSLASIVDLVVSLDYTQPNSNVLNDIIGVSGLKKLEEEFCMQPMFRIIPGFVNPNQVIHGNDVIGAGPGSNVVIGDDIRGFTGLDLSVFSEIEILRARMDAASWLQCCYILGVACWKDG